MPLHPGKGKKVRSKNIAMLINEGYPKDQAVAMAYSNERRGKRATRTAKRKNRKTRS